MLKSFFILSGFLLVVNQAVAQQSTPYVIAAGGDYFTAGTFTNSFTVGEEALVQTFTGSTFVLTQGFQQPNDGPNAILDPQVITKVTAYPNPTSGMLSLNYNLLTANRVTVEVYDLAGKLLLTTYKEQQAGLQREQLDLSALSDGAYFVNLRIDGRQVLVNRIHIVH